MVAVALVGLVAAAAWWWPTDRRRIIAAAQELAEAVSMPPSEPELARVTRAARLSRLLAPDFRLVDSQDGRSIVDGRDAAVGFATRLRPPQGLQVSVDELDLEIDAGGLRARARTRITLTEPVEGAATEPTSTWRAVSEWTKGDAWALSVLAVAPIVVGE
jgi:hypothetical protein